MSANADFLVLAVVVLDLYILATGRLAACVRATALQGVALGAIPLVLWGGATGPDFVPIAVMSTGTLLVKGIVIPRLLFRAIREADVRREVEPFVSLHLSVLAGLLLVIVSFWLAKTLVLPVPAPSTLLVPGSLATLLLGFLVLVTRRKAVTQVVGYLMIENGVFVFGQVLAGEVPIAVELGILLDVLVGVFVFGIAIYHIGDEFDHIDTAALSALRD